MSYLKFKSFTNDDAQAFCGAYQFKDGSKPIIAEMNIYNMGDAVCVCSESDNGCSIGIYMMDGDDCQSWSLETEEFESALDACSYAASILKPAMAVSTLYALGFNKLS